MNLNWCYIYIKHRCSLAHQSDDVPFVSPWQTNDGQAVLLPLPCPRIETAVLGGEVLLQTEQCVNERGVS